MAANLETQSPIDLSLLPALPTVAREILTKFDDEFVAGEEVAAIVSKDPGITARLVAIANSAYFGLPSPVTDMAEIVVRVLGVDNVRALTLALATSSVFKSTSKYFDLQEYWLRAFYVAEACRRASYQLEDCTDMDRQLAYTTGFCGEIGWIALATLSPDIIDQCIVQGKVDDGDMDEDETANLLQQHLGMTPSRATAELARHWKMPDRICEAYDSRSDAVSSHSLGQALHLADRVWLYRHEDQTAESANTDESHAKLFDAATPTRRYQEKIETLVGALAAS